MFARGQLQNIHLAGANYTDPKRNGENIPLPLPPNPSVRKVIKTRKHSLPSRLREGPPESATSPGEAAKGPDTQIRVCTDGWTEKPPTLIWKSHRKQFKQSSHSSLKCPALGGSGGGPWLSHRAQTPTADRASS